MDDYFIELPKGLSLHDVQINFLKNASYGHSLRHDQLSEEIEFLDNQYVIVKNKIYF